jgi:hypothetical protein
MKTRTKKVSKATPATKNEEAETTTGATTLEAAVASPPHLFVLPKDASPEARIVTLPNPATSSPNRYFVCPEKGFSEFTKIAAPKRACRSWLMAPQRLETEGLQEGSVTEDTNDEGYVLEKPEMFIATPVDPLFIVLSLLVDGEQGSYLTFADYVFSTEQSGMEHLQQLLRQPSFAKLESILEQRMAVICDTLDMGDGEDRMYQLSNAKLLEELVTKAKRMVERGLPASMEDHFVKQALEVPVLSIRREESSISISIAADDATPGAESEAPSVATSQDTTASTATSTSVSTAATSVAATPSEEPKKPDETAHLLRLRTALSFLQTSYIPPSLHVPLTTALSSPTSPIDFTPLNAHLAHIAELKKQAQALRSISDNISRKRSVEEDEEAMEKAEAKKRKKEEEELKKKNMSRGVQQLKKADTTGMKKLSSFFTKKAPAVGVRTSPRKKG